MEKLLGGNLRALLWKELSEEAKFSLKFASGVKPSWDEIAAKAGALVGWDDCSSLGLFPRWEIRNQELPNPFFLPLRATSTPASSSGHSKSGPCQEWTLKDFSNLQKPEKNQPSHLLYHQESPFSDEPGMSKMFLMDLKDDSLPLISPTEPRWLCYCSTDSSPIHLYVQRIFPPLLTAVFIIFNLCP